MQNTWEAIYFVYSFTYLVGRTCTVSLYAASINDQSKKPKAVLFSVPTESYGVEVNLSISRISHNFKSPIIIIKRDDMHDTLNVIRKMWQNIN